MGTLNVVRTQYAQDTNRNVPSTIASEATSFTTSGTAANVTGISLKAGDILSIDAATSHWIAFGGTTAAVGTGHHILAGIPYNFEVDRGHEGQPISAIEG